MTAPPIYISTQRLRGLSSGNDWPGITTVATPDSVCYEPAVPRCKTCERWMPWDIDQGGACELGQHVAVDGSGYCSEHQESKL